MKEFEFNDSLGEVYPNSPRKLEPYNLIIETRVVLDYVNIFESSKPELNLLQRRRRMVKSPRSEESS